MTATVIDPSSATDQAVTVTSAGERRRDLDDQVPMERPTAHLLILPSSGRGTHNVDFRSHQVGRGVALHVQPGQVHHWDPTSRFKAVVITIHPELCPPGLFVPAETQPVVPLGPAAPVVMAVAADLAREQETAKPNQAVMATSAALLLQHVARARSQVSQEAPAAQIALLRSFRTELERSFTATRSVSDYARRIGTSPKTLSRATAGLTGRSPKELIDRRVVLEARRLLAYTTDPAAVIGSHLGFSEPTNFTKFFARHTGTSPQEFRAEA